MRHDKNGGMVEKLKIMTAGAISGLASWVFTYPIDFVKTKMQSENLDSRKYRNSWHCFIQNYREHGWMGFTRGLWTVCLRSIPVNSAAFLIEDETANLLGRKGVNEW
jgi:solute carrier family 25 (mitochondrial carnitine/acylcarnitine transporter), member 20/29